MASIYQEYFKITKEYQSLYGKNTIVLMQVGAFFEIYGIKNGKTNEITNSQITEFAQFCNLNISEKKNSVDNNEDHYMMAGFRDYTLDKYLQKITENGYTAVVFVQEKEGKSIKRILHSIHSPGTYLSYETDSSPQMTNHIMCIWFEKTKPILQKSRDTLVCGFSVVNIFTGKSYIYEYQLPFLLNPTTFDELERSLSVFSPSEVILIYDMEESIMNTIIQYAGIKTNTIHKMSVRNKDSANLVKIQHCQKQNYIQHMIQTFFQEETYHLHSEFTSYPIATQSFCFLLDFIKEHNPNLVRKISLPLFNNSSDRVILANHTLKQLNIIDDHSMDSKRTKRFSSIVSLLNRCSSPMGSRLFQSQLTNPVFNEEWLKKEYDMTECFLCPTHFPMVLSFRKQLVEIRDIEKVCRQLMIQKIYPASIYHLYKSAEWIQQMNMCLYENPEIVEYVCRDFSKPNTEIAKKHDYWETIDSTTKQFLAFLDSQIHIDQCKGIHSSVAFEETIFRDGVSPELDDILRKYAENLNLFETIREQLNQMIKKEERNEDLDHVKKHETEKNGFSLIITKTRGKTLKTILSRLLIENPESKLKLHSMEIPLKDIKFVSATGSNDEIICSGLSQICKNILALKEESNRKMAIVYQTFLSRLEKEWFQSLEHLAVYVAKLDVITTKAYIAKEYHYCRPEIKQSSKSFLNAYDLRHPLIEHLNTNELYVPNDVCIGLTEDGKNTAPDGILLFGTNAVGKTSLIRAIGISIIMAQCGCYVPCSKFEYKPYTAIYSRILGNDNIFKGLSTFMVEMSELRTILKMADEKSLILGDELASGTENESALSIFTSGLMDLHKKRASFLFATHMHEITYFEEISILENLSLFHLEVVYDREKDSLIYNRKLKKGAGNRMYGLEVCKSLHMPDDFLENAIGIRNKYFPDVAGNLSNKSSVYNSKKIRGICELCKEQFSEETHHIHPQKEADENGFIGGFHKNHPANLMAVCEKCHHEIHIINKDETWVRKKTTKGYILTSKE